jgi:hypothetical protein
MTLQATNALTDVSLAQALTADAALLHRLPATTSLDASECAYGTTPRSSTAGKAFDIGGFEVVRKFVEHLAAEHAKDGDDRSSAGREVDWDALVGSLGGSTSLETAIGRAIVVADRLIREPSCDGAEFDVFPVSTLEDPFFDFSMADVVPDFGPDRYRSRVARRVANMIGKHPPAVVRD